MAFSKKRMMRSVTASELAQMGMCERLIVFEHRHGKRSSASQRAARQHGLTEHDRFYQEAVRTSGKKGRCDIATLVCGEGPETATLRLLRDRVLRKNSLGRWLISGYYRSAPAVCAVLIRHAWLRPLARTLTRPVAWMAGRALRRKWGDRDR